MSKEDLNRALGPEKFSDGLSPEMYEDLYWCSDCGNWHPNPVHVRFTK